MIMLTNETTYLLHYVRRVRYLNEIHVALCHHNVLKNDLKTSI